MTRCIPPILPPLYISYLTIYVTSVIIMLTTAPAIVSLARRSLIKGTFLFNG
jgi:hypothetical protein